MCSTCHSSFTKRTNLKRHIRSSHMNVKYKCNICKEEYKRKDYLPRHIKSAHPMPTSTQMPSVTTPVNQDMDFNPDTDFDLDLFENPTYDYTPCDGRPAIRGSPFFTNICKAKTACSQTQRRKLPKKLNLVHQHTSTSPIFQRD